MEGTLVKYTLGECLGVIRRGTYQVVSEDRRWEYEPVSDLCPDLEPDSDCSYDGSSDEVRKDQDNLDDQ